MRRTRRQQLLFAIDQVRGVERGQFESMSVRNGVGGTGLNAVSAKNAAVVVNVIDLGVTLGPAHAVLGRVLCCLNVNAIGGTVGRAKKAGDTLLQAILVTLQYV